MTRVANLFLSFVPASTHATRVLMSEKVRRKGRRWNVPAEERPLVSAMKSMKGAFFELRYVLVMRSSSDSMLLGSSLNSFQVFDLAPRPLRERRVSRAVS